MEGFKSIDGGDLGTIILRRNPRARRYLLRVKEGQVYATMPRHGNEQALLTFVHEQHDRLLQMLQKSPKRRVLNEGTELNTLTFSLQIARKPLNNIYYTLKDSVLHISCPLQTEFSDEWVQKILYGILESVIRVEAKRHLPQRLKVLAEKHKFQYASVKVNNSRTHWGSCTSRKSINLSLSVMLLPEHLVDYILLHELCHTIEMNHGERFWALMDKVTGGHATAYRKEVKSFGML